MAKAWVVWDVFVLCAGAKKDMSFEVGSSQSSTKEKRECKRHLDALGINEGIYDKGEERRVLMALTEGNTEVMLKGVKSRLKNG